jgi:hypothetical protein
MAGYGATPVRARKPRPRHHPTGVVAAVEQRSSRSCGVNARTEATPPSRFAPAPASGTSAVREGTEVARQTLFVLQQEGTGRWTARPIAKARPTSRAQDASVVERADQLAQRQADLEKARQTSTAAARWPRPGPSTSRTSTPRSRRRSAQRRQHVPAQLKDTSSVGGRDPARRGAVESGKAAVTRPS